MRTDNFIKNLKRFPPTSKVYFDVEGLSANSSPEKIATLIKLDRSGLYQITGIRSVRDMPHIEPTTVLTSIDVPSTISNCTVETLSFLLERFSRRSLIFFVEDLFTPKYTLKRIENIVLCGSNVVLTGGETTPNFKQKPRRL